MATSVMAAGDAATVMRELQHGGVDACLSGGWAVDALLGEHRVHSDLDLWLAAPGLEGRHPFGP